MAFGMDSFRFACNIRKAEVMAIQSLLCMGIGFCIYRR